MLNKKIMSIDAETNGLWGKAFAVSAILYGENGEELKKVVYRLPNNVVTNQWVIENVLPPLNNLEVTHNTYEEMLKDFAVWYLENKEGSEVLYHMGHVVEAFLFREMHDLGFIGDWDAPYTPIEVSELLRINGYAPDSVDAYVKQNNIAVSNYGSTHNPLFDCEVAAKVYFHITKK